MSPRDSTSQTTPKPGKQPKKGGVLQSASYWLIAKATLGLLSLVQTLPADRALNAVDWLARRVGPLTPRHRLAVDNLRRAFPEKSKREIDTIARGMWGNMARLAAEYVFLDQLYLAGDDGRSLSDRVEVVGSEIFWRLASENRPRIFITAHLGNFELLPIIALAHGLNMTVMFRPPNNPYLAEELHQRRKGLMNALLPSRAGAAFALASVLEGAGNIGVLVDQKFRGGIRSTFFGRDCETNPLVPRLARRFECEVYSARCLRLPGNRFRIEIFEQFHLPLNEKGVVDVEKSAQALNDLVEGWVREFPEQWMWFHRRWDIKPRKAQPAAQRA